MLPFTRPRGQAILLALSAQRLTLTTSRSSSLDTGPSVPPKLVQCQTHRTAWVRRGRSCGGQALSHWPPMSAGHSRVLARSKCRVVHRALALSPFLESGKASRPQLLCPSFTPPRGPHTGNSHRPRLTPGIPDPPQASRIPRSPPRSWEPKAPVRWGCPPAPSETPRARRCAPGAPPWPWRPLLAPRPWSFRRAPTPRQYTTVRLVGGRRRSHLSVVHIHAQLEIRQSIPGGLSFFLSLSSLSPSPLLSQQEKRAIENTLTQLSLLCAHREGFCDTESPSPVLPFLPVVLPSFRRPIFLSDSVSRAGRNGERRRRGDGGAVSNNYEWTEASGRLLAQKRAQEGQRRSSSWGERT